MSGAGEGCELGGDRAGERAERRAGTETFEPSGPGLPRTRGGDPGGAGAWGGMLPVGWTFRDWRDWGIGLTVCTPESGLSSPMSLGLPRVELS